MQLFCQSQKSPYLCTRFRKATPFQGMKTSIFDRLQRYKTRQQDSDGNTAAVKLKIKANVDSIRKKR